MRTYEDYSINDIYPDMVRDVLEDGTVEMQRGFRTRELHPVIFELGHPERRLVTSYGRSVNVAFALAEVMWILQGRQDVEMLAPYNSRISDLASDDGEVFNAAYGYRLRHAHGFDQLEDIISTLAVDPGSRQATTVTWAPEDRGWNHNTVFTKTPHITKDRACNVLSHFMIRDGKLDLLQIVRSNDALWGTPYNVMQWTYIQEYVAARLGLDMGKYRHVADSFHIYDPSLDGSPLPDVSFFDLYAWLDQNRHTPLQGSLDATLADMAGLESRFRDNSMGVALDWDQYSRDGEFPRWADDMLTILYAHRLYRLGQDDAVYGVLHGANDQVYAVAQMRFYMQHRWKKREDLALHERLPVDYDSNVLLDWMYGRGDDD